MESSNDKEDSTASVSSFNEKYDVCTRESDKLNPKEEIVEEADKALSVASSSGTSNITNSTSTGTNINNRKILPRKKPSSTRLSQQIQKLKRYSKQKKEPESSTEASSNINTKVETTTTSPPSNSAKNQEFVSNLRQRLKTKNVSNSKPNNSSTSNASTTSTTSKSKNQVVYVKPSLEPHQESKLERFELFSTHQSYYLVACDKNSEQYRVLRMDRTLIEEIPTTITDPNNLEDVDTDADTSYNTVKKPLPSFCFEDSYVYNQVEIHEMLDMIHHGNLSHGGLCPVVKAYGIVGFIRFLDCYYLTLITKRTKVGKIGGSHGIYSIKQTETFSLKPAEHRGIPSHTNNDILPSNVPNTPNSNATSHLQQQQHQDPSSVLLNMWNRGKRSVGLGLTNREIAELRYQGLYQVVDLTKNFFFSYTYDMTKSLQENFLSLSSHSSTNKKDMYAWNHYLTKELQECCTSKLWILPIIHGSFLQRRIQDYGRSLNLILIARRSRHFAGTRYLKRGVSDRGKVANDVEHEQILHDETQVPESFSSFLQVRGSVPTFWTQESSVTMPKPPIVLNRVDPTYQATKAHFEDLLSRYCSPIVVLDLVKQSEKREREVILGNEFRHAIDYLNSQMSDPHKIRYCALDYSQISKHRSLSTCVEQAATWAVNQTGFFCSNPRWKIDPMTGSVRVFDLADNSNFLSISQDGVPVFPMEQQGILRTNCIDCLDRTNVAQFSAGVEALGQQLVVMGIRSLGKLDSSSNIVRALIDMYVEIGDHIALQYGGSEAHKKGAVVANGSSGQAVANQPSMGKHKELLTSIRRYYSNTFTDRLKQDAMNLFLGYYIPSRHSVPLWDMESDYYLHNFHVKADRATLQSIKSYEKSLAVHWSSDEEDIPKSKLSRHTSNETTLTLDTSLLSSSMNSLENRTRRMEKIRNRSVAQNDALSLWWRVAIQSYVQQRMLVNNLNNLPTYTEPTLPTSFEHKRNVSASSFITSFSTLDINDDSAFERRYQPSKLTQFDKIFARPWAVPFRSNNNIDEKDTHDDFDDYIKHSTNILTPTSSTPRSRQASPLKTKPSYRSLTSTKDSVITTERGEACPPLHGSDTIDVDDDNDDDNFLTLREYAHKFGFENKAEPHLQSFVLPFQNEVTCEDGWNFTSLSNRSGRNPTSWIQDYSGEYSVYSPEKKNLQNDFSRDSRFHFLGDLSADKSPRKEYVKYTSENIPSTYHEDTRKEFEASLYETNLHSDNVEGIRKLAESAYIGSQIRNGPYTGLHQRESAIHITSIIHEQYNIFSNARERGEDGSGALLEMNDRLECKNVNNSVGVKNEIMLGIHKFASTENSFNEIFGSSSAKSFQRSELTTQDSLKLYCSFFDDHTAVTPYQMSYMLGKKIPSETKSNDFTQNDIVSSSRNHYNFDINPYSHATQDISQELITAQEFSSIYKTMNDDVPSFQFIDNYRVPRGFEQINENLFARSENKYMVFNRPGVEAWFGINSLIRIGGVLDTLMESRKCNGFCET